MKNKILIKAGAAVLAILIVITSCFIYDNLNVSKRIQTVLFECHKVDKDYIVNFVDDIQKYNGYDAYECTALIKNFSDKTITFFEIENTGDYKDYILPETRNDMSLDLSPNSSTNIRFCILINKSLSSDSIKSCINSVRINIRYYYYETDNNRIALLNEVENYFFQSTVIENLKIQDVS